MVYLTDWFTAIVGALGALGAGAPFAIDGEQDGEVGVSVLIDPLTVPPTPPASTSPSPSPIPDGGLAVTGAQFPFLLALVIGAVLLLAGVLLVLRRRRAAQRDAQLAVGPASSGGAGASRAMVAPDEPTRPRARSRRTEEMAQGDAGARTD